MINYLTIYFPEEPEHVFGLFPGRYSYFPGRNPWAAACTY